MANKLRYTLPVLAAFLFMGLLTLNTAWGAELWVTPAVDPADTEVGDWAATHSAQTRFSFAVPDDFKELVSAKVVMIGRNDKETSADVHLSISQNESRYDDFTAALLGTPLSCKAAKLIEVDVSAIFPALNAGSDYASLHFEAKFARVLGLRFSYNRLVSADLATETAERVSADASLQSALDTETTERTAGDAAVQIALNAETSARQTAITTEEAARINFDNALQAELNILVGRVTALEGGLTTEIAARTSGDENLQNQLDSMQTEVSSLQSDVLTRSEVMDLVNENAMSIQPDYDSGWFRLEAGENVTLEHNLNLSSRWEQPLVFLLTKDLLGWQFSDTYWGMTEWWTDGDSHWEQWWYGANWSDLARDTIKVTNMLNNCNPSGPRPFDCLVSTQGVEKFHSFRILIWVTSVPD